MKDKLERFVQLLLEENQKQNLVSRKSGPEEIEQHIQDSLQALEWYELTGKDVVDIGSGAGFPGLVLAIGSPGSRMTLLESDLKKSQFLEQARIELGLANVRVIRGRAETLGRDEDHREKYDFCTSRAVAALRVVLEYGLPLVKEGGRVILWKGSGYPQEILEAKQALKQLGGEVEAVHCYKLIQDRDRAIVTVKKMHPTPGQFPRRTGIPAKKPL